MLETPNGIDLWDLLGLCKAVSPAEDRQPRRSASREEGSCQPKRRRSGEEHVIQSVSTCSPVLSIAPDL
jgi:hypothetical protein